MQRALVCYLSYSGNTAEIAEYIADKLCTFDYEVTLYEIGIMPAIDVSEYDLIFLGTFTWDYGQTPFEVKDFVLEIGYKPDNMAIFGSGDTQFGDESVYCAAVDRLVKFYGSKWRGLKIEQSPRGHQEQFITEWLEEVVSWQSSKLVVQRH